MNEWALGCGSFREGGDGGQGWAAYDNCLKEVEVQEWKMKLGELATVYTSLVKLKNEMERRLETPKPVTYCAHDTDRHTYVNTCSYVCSSYRQPKKGKGKGGIILYYQPVLNPKSYDGARVLEASGCLMLVIGCGSSERGRRGNMNRIIISNINIRARTKRSIQR